MFVERSALAPDHYCAHCTKAARLALAAKSAPKPASRCATPGCGSYAINPGQSGRDQASDLDLCDVCYWRKRASDPLLAPASGGEVMFHFRDNPTCSARTRDTEARVSVAGDIKTFRDCHSTSLSYCAECAGVRTDSDRYAELRKLVEAVQIDSKLGTARAALDALLDWRHR